EILTRKLRPSEQAEQDRKKAEQSGIPQARVQPQPKPETISEGTQVQKSKAQEVENSYESNYERARQLGYTGDSCPECGSMTMIRNGTCQKCITCGSTTGCS